MITLEKKYKINFLREKITPKLVVFQSSKKVQVLGKKSFSKKILKKSPCSLFVQTRSSKECAENFLK